jgi:2-polyprenyl-3-methyl-5-hydroxy-6-metoxy-1,4-benzoquinol methylase
MHYKNILYASYVSGHIAHRKGIVDERRLHVDARGYRQHFAPFLPREKSANIIDLGCGSGGLVWWLRHSGYRHAFGIDGSQEQVALAHHLGIQGVTLGDVFTILDQAEGQDLLLARDLIEHFDRQSIFDFLAKCRSALKPGGRIVIQVPNAGSPTFGRVRYGDFTHEIAFTESSMKQILGATGFTDIEVYPWRPAITGLNSLIRYVLWRMLEPILKLPIQIESGGLRRIITMNLIAVASRPT